MDKLNHKFERLGIIHKNDLFLALALFLSMSCSTKVQSDSKGLIRQDQSKTISISSMEECKVLGGSWGTFGILAIDECNLPTRDAGRPCKDHSECQSSCMTDESVPVGQAVVGRCYEWTITRGTCLNEVWGGLAQGVICVD